MCVRPAAISLLDNIKLMASVSCLGGRPEVHGRGVCSSDHPARGPVHTSACRGCCSNRDLTRQVEAPSANLFPQPLPRETMNKDPRSPFLRGARIQSGGFDGNQSALNNLSIQRSWAEQCGTAAPPAVFLRAQPQAPDDSLKLSGQAYGLPPKYRPQERVLEQCIIDHCVNRTLCDRTRQQQSSCDAWIGVPFGNAVQNESLDCSQLGCCAVTVGGHSFDPPHQAFVAPAREQEPRI